MSYSVQRSFGAVVGKRKDVSSVTYNDNYKYDLKVEMSNGRTMTFEVKLGATIANDYIEVEFETGGKKSGIAKSEADFWVFKTPDAFWTISAAKLKRLIGEQKFAHVTSSQDYKYFMFDADELKAEMKRYD